MLSKEQKEGLLKMTEKVEDYKKNNGEIPDCYNYMGISVETAAILNETIGRLYQNNGNPHIEKLETEYTMASKEVLQNIAAQNIKRDTILFKLLEESRKKVLSKKIILNPADKTYEEQKEFVSLLAQAQCDIEINKRKNLDKNKEEVTLYDNDEKMKRLSELNSIVNLKHDKTIHAAYIDTACKYLGRTNIIKENSHKALEEKKAMMQKGEKEKSVEIDLNI